MNYIKFCRDQPDFHRPGMKLIEMWTNMNSNYPDWRHWITYMDVFEYDIPSELDI